jgi:hypothetical protein
MKNQTTAMAPEKRGAKRDQRHEGEEAGRHVAVADDGLELHRHTGIDAARGEDRATDDAEHMDPEQRDERQLARQRGEARLDVPDRDQRIGHQDEGELDIEENEWSHESPSLTAG